MAGRCPGWNRHPGPAQPRVTRVDSGSMKPYWFVWLVLGSCSVAACQRQGPVAATPTQAPSLHITPTPIRAAEFAAAAHSILSSVDPSQKRLELLAGIVRFQFARAARLLADGQRDLGLAVVKGAIQLVRAGESRPEMWRGYQVPLLALAEEAARVGDEGQAQAAYSQLLSSQPSAALAQQTRQHQEAIDRFLSQTVSTSPVEAAGSVQRAIARRSSYDPSEANLQAAGQATARWMQVALQANVGEQMRSGAFDRDEAIEAFRAIRSGGATLAGVYLRHGAPLAAIEMVENSDLARIVPSTLLERLERAGEQNDPAAWLDLFRFYQSATQSDEPTISVDVQVADGAAWGSALELYRSAPQEFAAAGPLCLLLLDRGMAEVIPAVVLPTLDGEIGPEELIWSASLTQRALIASESVGGIEAARRVLRASEPMITRLDRHRDRGRLRIGAARLYQVMAQLEARHGNLEPAALALNEALRVDPSIEILARLVRVDRQRGQLQRALGHLDRLTSTARETKDLWSLAEALTLRYEIEQDLGDHAQAERSLAEALRQVLVARAAATPGEKRARAERLLARILELYQDQAGARRAGERAFEDSRSDTWQLTSTVLDVGRRALTQNDLQTGRQAVRWALDGQLADEDKIYVALWLRMVERQHRSPGDGTVEEALGDADGAPAWPSRLRAWALGQLSDDELLRSATRPSSQIEARFYRALVARAEGDAQSAHRLLASVAASSGIDLVEVIVARDLLRQEAQQRPFALPVGVVLP